MLPNLKVWLNHFEYHAQHPRRLPTNIPDALTKDERRLIAGSIAIFQLGERSEGSNLLRAAYHFAQLHGAGEVGRITELLIREEQQHATLLAAFMADHDIPLRRKHWTDSVFRRLRKLAELEATLTLLLTAELIGIVYYRSLEMATGSQRLRILSRILVADELAHAGLESDLLLAMLARKGLLGRRMFELGHRMLFMCAVLVVWSTHRAVLQRGGYRLGTFLKACRAQYSFYLEPPQLERARAAPLATTPYQRARLR